jgi:hypothetical protein
MKASLRRREEENKIKVMVIDIIFQLGRGKKIQRKDLLNKDIHKKTIAIEELPCH